MITSLVLIVYSDQGIKSWMSSKSSHIRPLILELPALERLKKCCGYDSAFIFDLIIKPASNWDGHKILNEFEFQPYPSRRY